MIIDDIWYDDIFWDDYIFKKEIFSAFKTLSYKPYVYDTTHYTFIIS